MKDKDDKISNQSYRLGAAEPKQSATPTKPSAQAPPKPPTHFDAFSGLDKQSAPTHFDAFSGLDSQNAPTHFDAFSGLDKQNITPQADEAIPPPTDADAPPEPDYTVPLGAYVAPAAVYAIPPEPYRWPPLANADMQAAPSPCFDAFLGDDSQSAPPLTDADVPPEPEPNTPPEPDWLIYNKKGANTVDLWAFVVWFVQAYDVRCIQYQFYLGSERYPMRQLRNKIYHEIASKAEISAQKITAIVQLLEDATTCDLPASLPEAIYFTNCTLVFAGKPISTHFDAFLGVDMPEEPQAEATPEKQQAQATPEKPLPQHKTPPDATNGIVLRKTHPIPIVPCRVPHAFNPNAPEPTRLLAFLNELLSPTDLLTLQEYLGYCLMPSTKAQKALFIIGKGGEGKSRLTVLMKLLLEDKAVVSSVSQIGERFFGALIENRLLFMDDDLQTAKFNATDAFKTLVTSESGIMVEQKYHAQYEIFPYTRFLFLGNQSVGSLHDKSEGFYRRVHILHTKAAKKGRQHNPNIIQDIWAAEQEAIILWLVKGALRLVRQNYRLTTSPQAKQALATLREDDNTALSFLKEQTFVYGKGYSILSSQLVAKYKQWCLDNDLFKVGGQAFKQTCEAYFAVHGGQYSNKVKSHLGYARGYLGVDIGY